MAEENDGKKVIEMIAGPSQQETEGSGNHADAEEETYQENDSSQQVQEPEKKPRKYAVKQEIKDDEKIVDEKHLMKTIIVGSDWEEVLSNIIEEESINPWNVDIVRLVDAFLKYIYNLKRFDFRVPARFILIAAILLRLKCEALVVKEQREKEEKTPEIDVNVPLLDMPIVRVPRKKVTMTDLVAALNKVIEFEERKKERKMRVRRAVEQLIEPEEDIEVRIERVYNEIKQGNITKFSGLVSQWEKEEIVKKFVPILHLSNDGKISCEQNELFGEIFITVLNNMHKDVKEGENNSVIESNEKIAEHENHGSTDGENIQGNSETEKHENFAQEK